MTGLLVVGSLLVIAGCVVRWGVGPASERADERLADCGDDVMAVADAVQEPVVYGVEEPIPYVPADFPASDADRAWLRRIGVDL